MLFCQSFSSHGLIKITIDVPSIESQLDVFFPMLLRSANTRKHENRQGDHGLERSEDVGKERFRPHAESLGRLPSPEIGLPKMFDWFAKRTAQKQGRTLKTS